MKVARSGSSSSANWMVFSIVSSVSCGMPKMKKPMVCSPAACAQRKALRTMSRVWPFLITSRRICGSPLSTPKPTRLQPAAFISWNSSASAWLTFMPWMVTQGTVFSPSSISARHRSLARSSFRFQMSSVRPISVARRSLHQPAPLADDVGHRARPPGVAGDRLGAVGALVGAAPAGHDGVGAGIASAAHRSAAAGWCSGVILYRSWAG